MARTASSSSRVPSQPADESVDLTPFKSPSPWMAKLSRWLGVRHGHRSESTLLGVNQIATVPGSAVVWLAMAFGVVLYHSSKFQINVGYAIAFGGFTVIMTSAWFSFFALRGIRMSAHKDATPCHVGQMVRFQIRIEETLGRHRRDLVVHAGTQEFAVTVEPKSAVLIEFDAPAIHRGALWAPMVKLSTPYPMGIWNTHHLWTPLQVGEVYPRAEEGAPPLHGTTEDQREGANSRDLSDQGDTMVAMRAYQPGDSPRRVAWRLFAKSDGRIIATKQSQSGGREQEDLWIDDSDLAHLSNPEQRLARLCAWVLQAHASGRPYGFRSLGLLLDPASGHDHKHRCLSALSKAAGGQECVAFEGA